MVAKKTSKCAWVLGVLLLLSGCGGSSPKVVESPIAGESSRSAGYPSPASAAAPAATFDGAAPAERPSERPGLGTEWGETRVSRVHDTSFVRESNRPFAVATVNYDDRRGAEAIARLHGHRDVGDDVAVAGGAISFAIKDASGEPLETIHAGDRNIVVGNAGERYSIVVTNHTAHRFESVVTVDGLDVVNGKPGTTENRGYVLMPFATLEIEGFRQSASAVAAFRFASVAESYAAQMGSARNVGVIGAAFFGERGDSLASLSDLRLRDTASPFPADGRFARPPRR
jgi:hypothetical protein